MNPIPNKLILTDTMKGKKHTEFYKFLEPYLERGNETEIALARKAYRRKYQTNWRKGKRQKEKELTVSWTSEELKIIATEAKRHKLSRTGFIKQSTLAYINKRYVVPDTLSVRSLLQFLAMQYNLIHEMSSDKEIGELNINGLLEKIDEQERAIRVALYSPKSLEQIITEAILKNSKTKEAIYKFLETVSHDT